MSDEPHYAYSEMTETWYRVHDYEDRGNGRIVAKGKTEVEADEVPEEQRERMKERLTGTNQNSEDHNE